MEPRGTQRPRPQRGLRGIPHLERPLERRHVQQSQTQRVQMPSVGKCSRRPQVRALCSIGGIHGGLFSCCKLVLQTRNFHCRQHSENACSGALWVFYTSMSVVLFSFMCGYNLRAGSRLTAFFSIDVQFARRCAGLSGRHRRRSTQPHDLCHVHGRSWDGQVLVW